MCDNTLENIKLYHLKSVLWVTRFQTVGSLCMAASLFLLPVIASLSPLVFLLTHLTFLILIIAPGQETSCRLPDSFPQTSLSLNHFTVQKSSMAPYSPPYLSYTSLPGFSGPT